jgi:hypothetical protein
MQRHLAVSLHSQPTEANLMSMSVVRRYAVSLLVALAVVASLAAPASAQVVVTGGVDVTNQYSFRGIRQNTEEASIWPYVDFGGTVYKSDGGLKAVTINAGTWNAFHTQIEDGTNLDGEISSNKWYESDLYATLGLGFGGGVTLGTTYTSYMSPGNWFSHVKELAFKLSVDDSMALGKGALKPYGLVAFELSDDGQADAGDSKGVYVELGIAPGVSGSKASLSVPIKVGLSAKDYYEFGTGTDSKFGYFSVAGIVTVPFNPHWNVHGGVELQAYGDNLRSYNAYGDSGDRRATGIASIGIGFTY